MPKGLNPNVIKVLGRVDEGRSAHAAAKEGKEVEKTKKHKPSNKSSKRWAKVKAAKTAIASVKHATNTTSMLRETQVSKQAYAVSTPGARVGLYQGAAAAKTFIQKILEKKRNYMQPCTTSTALADRLYASLDDDPTALGEQPCR